MKIRKLTFEVVFLQEPAKNQPKKLLAKPEVASTPETTT